MMCNTCGCKDAESFEAIEMFDQNKEDFIGEIDLEGFSPDNFEVAQDDLFRYIHDSKRDGRTKMAMVAIYLQGRDNLGKMMGAESFEAQEIDFQLLKDYVGNLNTKEYRDFCYEFDIDFEDLEELDSFLMSNTYNSKVLSQLGIESFDAEEDRMEYLENKAKKLYLEEVEDIYIQEICDEYNLDFNDEKDYSRACSKYIGQVPYIHILDMLDSDEYSELKDYYKSQNIGFYKHMNAESFEAQTKLTDYTRGKDWEGKPYTGQIFPDHPDLDPKLADRNKDGKMASWERAIGNQVAKGKSRFKAPRKMTKTTTKFTQRKPITAASSLLPYAIAVGALATILGLRGKE